MGPRSNIGPPPVPDGPESRDVEDGPAGSFGDAGGRWRSRIESEAGKVGGGSESLTGEREGRSLKMLRGIERSLDRHWVGDGFPVRRHVRRTRRR